MLFSELEWWYAPFFYVSLSKSSSKSHHLSRNFLEINSFEIKGEQETRVNKFGYLSIISCLALCVSTATISDGGDFNWTVHTIGATSFFILALYMVMVASKIYRELWVIKPFVSYWSYQMKKYTNFFIGGFIALQVNFKLFSCWTWQSWSTLDHLWNGQLRFS